MKNGKEFAEKMFSEMEDNNEVQERLYSTGSDELDELLERAFCEGYEYAQKEFSKKEKETKGEDNESHRGYGRAYLIGAEGGVAGRYAGKRAVKKAIEKGEKLEDAEKKGEKKAAKVGAAVGAATGAIAANQTRKIIKASKPEIKAALQDAGITLTKKNKKIATIAAGTAMVGGAAGWGALGGKLGTKKNNKERRANMKKNEK